MTGVADPYEEPLHPDLVVDTAVDPVRACLARIVSHVEALGYVAAAAAGRSDTS